MVTQSLEFKGLALPAVRAAGGYFAVRNKYDVAWGDLLLALLTPIGTRPMNRQFGSALHRVLMDPADPALAQIVAFTIRDTASSWCPHVTIHDVVVRLPAGSQTVSVTVAFGLVEDSQIESRTFSVSAAQFSLTGAQ